LNHTTSNFVTFFLNRNGVNSTVHGEFTISEVLPGYDEILSKPKLPVNELSGSQKLNQHWTTVLDAIVGPDGKNINLESIVKNTPSGKLATIIDSGFTLPQVPRAVSDAIYGRVNGASYSVEHGVWLIPCGQELNITVVFGGVSFPVHPLDISSCECREINTGEVMTLADRFISRLRFHVRQWPAGMYWNSEYRYLPLDLFLTMHLSSSLSPQRLAL